MNYFDYSHIFEEGVPFFIADTVFDSMVKSEEHTHNFWEFFLVKKGLIRHCHNGKTYDLEKGDLFFVAKDDQHYFFNTQPEQIAVIVNLAFKESLILDVLKFIGQGSLGAIKTAGLMKISGKASQGMLEDLEQLYLLMDQKQFADAEVLVKKILLSVISAQFIKINLKEPTHVPNWLSDACKLMERPENLSKGTSRLFELCDRSKEHVNRQMQKHYNITPSEFVNKLRVNHAAKMLRSSNSPIGEIAFSIGFESVSYFNRTFKRHYNITPTAYRISNRRLVYYQS